MKYNSNGEVIGINDIPEDAMKKTAANGAAEYVTAIEKVDDSVNEFDTVLYQEAFTAQAKTPYLIGSTLYVTTEKTEGFYVASDVKVVLIQTNDRKTTTTYDEGVSALEDIVDDLNKCVGNEKTHTAGTYNYTVNAILEAGAAKVVIIVDACDSTGNKGTDISTAAGISVSLNSYTNTITVDVSKKADATDDEIQAAVGKFLLSKNMIPTSFNGVESVSATESTTIGNVNRTFTISVEGRATADTEAGA